VFAHTAESRPESNQRGLSSELIDFMSSVGRVERYRLALMEPLCLQHRCMREKFTPRRREASSAASHMAGAITTSFHSAVDETEAQITCG
jgi:DNA-binding GntR family transcriptional regulator